MLLVLVAIHGPVLIRSSVSPSSLIRFLLTQRVAQRGYCCRNVAVRLSHAGIVSKLMKISSNFFSAL